MLQELSYDYKLDQFESQANEQHFKEKHELHRLYV